MCSIFYKFIQAYNILIVYFIILFNPVKIIVSLFESWELCYFVTKYDIGRCIIMAASRIGKSKHGKMVLYTCYAISFSS